jgi:hypothetical protein
MGVLVDKNYFRELTAAVPQNVCRRAGCRYEDKAKAFTLTVWGEEYAVYPLGRKIERHGVEPADIDDLLGLFIIYYLLNCKDLNTSGEWVSEKDMRGGVTFFRGPHKIPTELISARFNRNLSGFGRRCRQLNGSPLAMADGAYSFSITHRIPIAVLFWDGDDDFPAEAKILFDRTITAHLTLDIVFSLADVVCRRIAGMNRHSQLH